MFMYIDEQKLVRKEIIYPGNDEFKELPKDTKLTFHFKTQKLDDDETVIDDSRKLGRPMELIVGKSFKLEVWETCLKTMRLKEVAKFSVDKSLVTSYPWVSKTLRKALGGSVGQNVPSSSHCCGMMAFKKESLGHADLDELVENLQNLAFTIELLTVEFPGEYAREAWAMSDEEKLKSVPTLREEGNALYQKKEYEAAANKYAEALGRLEHLILREKPGEEEWIVLDKMKIPLLLNFSQCKLLLGDYYPVIEHTTTVLDKDPNNVKALYRRAKAHIGAWNPAEARRDFMKVTESDPTMASTVKKELHNLDLMQREKDKEDAGRLKGKIF